MMVNDLIKKHGHSRELAEKSIEKEYKLENLEWLQQPLDTDLQPLKRANSVYADLNIHYQNHYQMSGIYQNVS